METCLRPRRFGGSAATRCATTHFVTCIESVSMLRSLCHSTQLLPLRKPTNPIDSSPIRSIPPPSLLLHSSFTPPSRLLHASSFTLPSLLLHSSFTPPALLLTPSFTPPSLLLHSSFTHPSLILHSSFTPPHSSSTPPSLLLRSSIRSIPPPPIRSISPH
jgi:hypothetical protein